MRALPAVRSALAGAALIAFATAAAAVDVNTATQAELERVRGIGVQLSTRLLAERGKRPFAHWQDLRARGGIGPTQARLLSAAGLTVDGAAWPADPQGASAP